MSISRPDLSLPNIYFPILQKQYTFKAKVTYALRCILNSIQSHNPNYSSNLQYILTQNHIILRANQEHSDPHIAELSLRIFYKLRSSGEIQGSQQIMRMVKNHNFSNDITEEFLEASCKLLGKCRLDSPQSLLLAYDLMQKYNKAMNKKQIGYLVQFIQKYSNDFDEMKNTKLFEFESIDPKKIMEIGIERWAAQSISQNQIQQIIDRNIMKYPGNMEITYHCVYLANFMKNRNNLQCENFLQTFLNENPKPIYLSNTLVSAKNSKISAAHSLQYFEATLKYLIESENKIQVIELINHPKQRQKQLLTIIEMVNNHKEIPTNLQEKYYHTIPISLLNEQHMIAKLKSSKQPSDAFLCWYRYHNKKIRFSSLKILIQFCVEMKKIFLINNKRHQLKVIRTLLKKQKVTVESLVQFGPSAFILLSEIEIDNKKQFEELYMNNRKQFENYFKGDHYSSAQKSDLCYWSLKIHHQQIVQNYIQYFLKEVRRSPTIIEDVLYYVRKKQEYTLDDLNWLYQHFHDELQRILEIIFTLLGNQHTESAVRIIFNLNAINHFNIFQEWLNIYRWALNPLQSPDFQDPDKVLDFLEVFESIIESHCSVPIKIIEKYCQIIIEHWQKFAHEHIFSIERALGHLCQSILEDNNLFQELIELLKRLQTKRKSYNEFKLSGIALRTLLSYVLDHNTEDNQIDLDRSISKAILEKNIQHLSSPQFSKGEIRELIYILQLFIWRFQYAQTTIDPKITQLIFSMIHYRQKLKHIWGHQYGILLQICLQIVATMNHSGNLLSLPLNSIFMEFPSNKKILQSCLDIIESVKDANPKALTKYKLQEYIESTLIHLIIIEDEDLEVIKIDILERLLDYDSPYKTESYKRNLIEILVSQRILENCRYRKNTIQFSLKSLKCIDQKMTRYQRQLRFIYMKYMKQGKIREICGDFGVSDCPIDQQQLLKSKQMSQNNSKAVQTPGIKQQQQSNHQKQIPSQHQGSKIQHNLSQKSIHQSNQSPQIPPFKTEKSPQIPPFKATKSPQIPPFKTEKSPQIPLFKATKSPQILPFKATKSLQISVPQDNHLINNYQFTSPKKINLQTKQQNRKQPEIPVNLPLSKNLDTTDHIYTIKQYHKYLDKLLKQINSKVSISSQQEETFIQSMKQISITASIHPYYCQKINNFGIPVKVLKINHQMCDKYNKQVLSFYLALAVGKEKSSVILHDKIIFSFFHNNLKSSLTSKNAIDANQTIIQIISHIWSTTISRKCWESGIWTLLIQLIKEKVHYIQILQFLSDIQMNSDVIESFYARNIMQTVIKQFSQAREGESSINQLFLWVNLVSKLCVNQSFREKIFEKNAHELVFKSVNIIKQYHRTMELAVFFGNICCEFQRCCDWCIEKGLPALFHQELLSQKTLNESYFKFFEYFSLNNLKSAKHLYSINYHLTLIKILKDDDCSKNKHFYRSLTNLLIPEYYRLFINQGVFMLLMRDFQEKYSQYIIKCALRLIEELQTVKDYQEIKSQGFQKTQMAFDSKVRGDESYEYIIEMYICLLDKFGNIDPQMFTKDYLYIILRKGIFSINIRGKKMVVKLFNTISKIDKINYGNANFIRIFQSILNYHTELEQLNYLLQYLKIETQFNKPPRKTIQQAHKQAQRYPMRFKLLIQIPQNPVLQILLQQMENRLIALQNKHNHQAIIEVNLICQILGYFLVIKEHAVRVYNKIGEKLQGYQKYLTIQQKTYLIDLIIKQQPIQKMIKLYPASFYLFLSLSFSIFHQDPDNSQLQAHLASILSTTFTHQLLDSNSWELICDQIRKSHLNTKDNFKLLINQPISKPMSTVKKEEQSVQPIMQGGIKVRMYKQDSSSSDLVLYLSRNLKELNCSIRIGEAVKQKWRMYINEIKQIQQYSESQQFKNSAFCLSEGIFSKAPSADKCLSLLSLKNRFHICFESGQKKSQWAGYIKTIINSANR